MKKVKMMMSLLFAFVLVMATLTTSAKAETAVVTTPDITAESGTETGIDSYGRTYTKTEIAPNRYVISGYYRYDLTVDYNIGWYEYRGLHVYRGYHPLYIEKLGWFGAVNQQADTFAKALDATEDSGDTLYENYRQVYISVEDYWKWKNAQ